jgi:hypothetical protein
MAQPKSSDCLHLEGKEGSITHSQYLAHLGSYKAFIKELESSSKAIRSAKEKMVFISDGAPWLRNWIEDTFWLEQRRSTKHALSTSGLYEQAVA